MSGTYLVQKKIVFEGPGRARIHLGHEPLGRSSYDIAVETTSSLISAGTEIALLRGNGPKISGRKFPFVPNATITGTVIEVGEAVSSVRPDLTLGIRVVAKGQHAAYQTFNVLSKPICIVPAILPDDIVLLGRLSQIAHYAVELIDRSPSRSVLVIGLGLVGQLILRAAAIFGHGPLFATDPHPNRLASAEKTSATTFLAPQSPTTATEAVFVACANPNAIREGLNFTTSGGICVIAGAGTGETPVDIAKHVFRRGVRLIGAHEQFVPNRSQISKCTFTDGLNMLSDDCFTIDGLELKSINVDSAPAAYNTLQSRKDDYIGIVIKWTK